MSTLRDQRFWIGHSAQLVEGTYLRIDATYAGDPTSLLVFRYKGICRAYRNLCVHMPRELDCENDMIFDETGQLLRCSMHGIVYDPLTGESLSTLCSGQRLTPVRVMEDETGIWIKDRRVRPRMAADGG